MSSSLDKSAKSGLSVQVIVLSLFIWAVLALLFFLLFSVPEPGQERPVWYSLGTSVFETVAYFSAAWLCLRNWRSPQIVSGRNVWLGIGLGMLFYGLGSLLFTYWESFLGRDPAVSPGDFFYVLTYLCLVWGMGLAVGARRLNLEGWQWVVLGAIALLGTIFAILISSSPSPDASKVDLRLLPPAHAQAAPPTAPAKATPKANTAPAVKASPKVVAPLAAPKPPVTAPVVPEPKALGAEEKPAPAWVKATEDVLSPLKKPLDFFYVIADVVLLIIATTLLLAFWGGRFSRSWQMIAAAAACLYIADMSFKYATTYTPNYESGGLLEVFWVFSGVLFGIGAALEFDLSRSRRTGSRRRT
jgi:hypothetical protein